MKTLTMTAGMMVGAMSLTVLCQADPPPRVVVPPPDDPKAYQPVPMPKPLPQMEAPPAPGVPMPNPSIQNEDAFLQAYLAHQRPRIMVFVNRTVTGELKDGTQEVQRVEVKEKATGPVDVNSQTTSTSSGQSSSAGYTGNSVSRENTHEADNSSFKANGPAEYNKTTSTKVAGQKYDSIGAGEADYGMIEASLVKYFDNSGKVQIEDADAVRAKLDREKVLRLENGDAAAVRLLGTEFQQDILIRVCAAPSSHTANGPGVRVLCKAVSVADGRRLGTAFIDIPLPLTKQIINVYTRRLASDLMGDMTVKWTAAAGAVSPVEVRIYKSAGVEDVVKIRKWLQATQGVSDVNTIAATSGSKGAYAAFRVGYAGAPEDLYADLKDAIGAGQGLKAVDLTNSTIDLEMVGQLHLKATRKAEATTKNAAEEKRVEPINPAPHQ